MAVWKITYVPEHLSTDQSQVTKCFYSLYGLPVAVLAIPVKSAARANEAKSAKLIVDYLFHVHSEVHTFALTQMQRCV